MGTVGSRSAAASAATASSASAAPGDADLCGRVGDPRDGYLPAAASSSAPTAAAAGAGTGLIGSTAKWGKGSPRGGPFFCQSAAAAAVSNAVRNDSDSLPVSFFPSDRVR